MTWVFIRPPSSVGALKSITTATLADQATGAGFFEITRRAARFLDKSKARSGALLLFVRHTSASLVIQENADVHTDLVTALSWIAPADAGWIHDIEGPDNMQAHVKSMLNGVSLHVPVSDGQMTLGTCQGIYVAEHRDRPNRRELVLDSLGSCEEV